MTNKKRVLYIASEMSPFLELTEFSEFLNGLVVKSFESGYEIRCIMPRFGLINERRHKLHEVVRLSGINISVDDDDYPLQIKVASLPNARLQVYFLDNDDLFKRKATYHDENGSFFEDNSLRKVFFCKGALETVKKFGWPPDIIHCSGWMSSLIPMYLKTVYKKDAVFGNAKVVYALGGESFEETLSDKFKSQLMINGGLKGKSAEGYFAGDYLSLVKSAATNSDAIAFASDTFDKQFVTDLSKTRGKKIVKFSGFDSDFTEYLDLYSELAP